MKNILLTTTALVAFAGAAAAEVSFKGDAELGYNDDVENGVYWSMGLTVTAAQELNNGLEAGFTLDVDLDDDRDDGEAASTFSQGAITTSDFVLHLKSDTAGLYYGDTDTAAEKLWTGVTNMIFDGFAENGDDSEDAVLRAEGKFGNIEAALSAAVKDTNGGTEQDDVEALQVAAKYDAGAYNFTFAYQNKHNVFDITSVTGETVEVDGEDVNITSAEGFEIIGATAGTTFSGIDLMLSIAQAKNTKIDAKGTSIGLQGSYTFGSVKTTAFYVFEDVDGLDIDDNYGIELSYAEGPITVEFWAHGGFDEEIGLEGSYDFQNGLKAYAGYIQNDGNSEALELYVAGEYDLGNGATLKASYADSGNEYTGDQAEIGDHYEVNDGATVAVSFKF